VSKAIGDLAVLAVLHPFVRATRPMLAALRESDPFGLQSGLECAARRANQWLGSNL
jgi:hypothetical protein